MHKENQQIVFTNKARCRDCYRCVRICPVKAIKLKDGQAEVVGSRCINCGTCTRECPQQAKSTRSDLATGRQIIDSGCPVAAAVAPSFSSIYRPWECRRLPSALRMLGFKYVEETAVGARYAADKAAEYVEKNPEKPHIGSDCPAVVSWIEKYHHDKVENLLPLLSPMRTHAALMRKRYGENLKVIFIGPCLAKKHEADISEGMNKVDCALTFNELKQWFEECRVRPDQCEESAFDRTGDRNSQLYALEGGCLLTANIAFGPAESDALAVSGMGDINRILDAEWGKELRMLEPLFCPGGCVSGPGNIHEVPKHEQKKNAIKYLKDTRNLQSSKLNTNAVEPEIDIKTSFAPESSIKIKKYTEDDIRKVLQITGKTAEEDQLNCGACGYDSCRDQSMAVLDGMAEPGMCIPYMRRLAEQRSDKIMETSPNGILILNGELMIMQFNPAFRKMFMCSDMVLGRHVSYLMDAEPFERLQRKECEIVENIEDHKVNNLTCRQIFYALPDERQYVGIFDDITRLKRNTADLNELRRETVEKAKELLEHQIESAQHMTRILGENSARGEKLVARLLELAKETNDDEKEQKSTWNIYTPK